METANPTENFDLTIFHNNDGESKLLPSDVHRGIARFTNKLDELKGNASGESIMLSSGDNFLAGTVFNSGLYKSEIMYDALAMEDLGYNAICLGNHDFDFGPDILRRFIDDFINPVPLLSANLDYTNKSTLLELQNEGKLNKSVILIKGGEKIGVIGLTTPQLRSISSPRDVIINENLCEIVNAEADSLANLGVNKIILILHLQNLSEDTTLIHCLSGIDIVIAGGGDELLGTSRDTIDEEDLPYKALILCRL